MKRISKISKEQVNIPFNVITCSGCGAHMQVSVEDAVYDKLLGCYQIDCIDCNRQIRQSANTLIIMKNIS